MREEMVERRSSKSRWRRWLLSTDHRILSIRYLVAALLFLMIAGWLAMLVRWQLGFPGMELPQGLRQLVPPGIANDGRIAPQGYNVLFTMHATFMIYYAIVPLLVGVFGNFLIPLQIGAGRLAFPRLSAASFWLVILSAVVMIASMVVSGGGAATGWTAYPPLAGDAAFTSYGTGQDLWCVALIIYGIAAVMGGVSQAVTVVTMRAPGMRWLRLPLPVWGAFITALIVVATFPVLVTALGMLLSDRLAQTSFFMPAGLTISGMPLTGREGGGDPLLWQHLFWFFGHPVVYIMILPAMGIVSEILAVFSRRPAFGYRGMVVSTIAIGLLGFLVWGHHMFQSGMNPTLGTAFMLSTMVIAVPSAVKVFNWLGTIWGGEIELTTPMLHALAFVALFTIGGLSGIFMASTPVDTFIHDTYFIVAHIHYVLFGGTLFAVFGGIHFWFPKLTGRMLDERLGKIHFWITLVAFNATFFPMHLLGAGGFMRRIFDYRAYQHLGHLEGLNRFITIAAFLLGLAQIIFVVNLLWSLRRGRVAEANPWRSTTLEWELPSPPREGNFAAVPVVYHAPYEHSLPDDPEAFLRQTAPAAPPRSDRGTE